MVGEVYIPVGAGSRSVAFIWMQDSIGLLYAQDTTNVSWFSSAWDISNGLSFTFIIGLSTTDLGLDLATLWYPAGTAITLQLPASSNESRAYGVNDSALVVGYARWFEDSLFKAKATLWQNGPPQDLGAPDIPGRPDLEGSIAFDVNRQGLIVGKGNVVENNVQFSHAMLWDGNQMIDLAGPGGSFAEARAINDWGQVVGGSHLWENGKLYLLDTLILNGPLHIADAKDINENGYILADSYLLEPIEPSDVENQTSSVPNKFELHQNYPNPFNPTTTIRFGLPKATHIKIDLFNIIGQKVASLIQEKKAAGYHSINFDGSSLASGIYLYRIQAGEYSDVKKMILMKQNDGNFAPVNYVAG